MNELQLAILVFSKKLEDLERLKRVVSEITIQGHGVYRVQVEKLQQWKDD